MPSSVQLALDSKDPLGQTLTWAELVTWQGLHLVVVLVQVDLKTSQAFEVVAVVEIVVVVDVNLVDTDVVVAAVVVVVVVVVVVAAVASEAG